MIPAPLHPECRDGKHLNCEGGAWDDQADALTACTCACHTPEEPAR
jgi:hypothetical protein